MLIILTQNKITDLYYRHHKKKNILHVLLQNILITKGNLFLVPLPFITLNLAPLIFFHSF